MKDLAIRNPGILFRKELTDLEQSIDRLSKGLSGGRVEHEAMPDLQKILAELKPFIGSNLLSQVEAALGNNASDNRRELTEAAITTQLRIYLDQAGLIDPDFAAVQASAFNFFSKREPSLSNKKAESKATFLVYLRDIALEMTLFLQRPVADSLNDFIELYHLKQREVGEKAVSFSLSKNEVKAANDFLEVSATLVLLQKIEMVADDYLKSGTDIRMANGRIWASRYNRYDYVPFFFEPLEELQRKYPFSFARDEILEQLSAVRVKVKAESLNLHSPAQAVKDLPVNVRLTEIQFLWGLILNFTFSEWQQWFVTILQILDVKTVQALESDQTTSQLIKQKLSRIRYCIHLYSILFHDSFVKAKKIKSQQLKTNQDQKEHVLKSAFQDFEKIFLKLKFELEVVGLSALPVAVEGKSHGKLEGLSEWVNEIIEPKTYYFKYLIAYELGLFEQAYRYFSSYLAALLGVKDPENFVFDKLTGLVKVNTRTGAQHDSLFFSSRVAVFDENFIQQLISNLRNATDFQIESFLKAFPILVRLAAEFSDFDRGLSLMLAHRHLMYEIWKEKLLPDYMQQLLYIVDAEVRFRFGYKRAGESRPQLSAIKLLAEKQDLADYYRQQAYKHISFKQLGEVILLEAVSGQYISTRIRHLRAYVRLVKSKSQAKNMANLVRKTVQKRLLISSEDFAHVSNLFNANADHSNIEPAKILLAKELESRAVAATKMLLDCSLVCAEMGENKASREMLEFSVKSYKQLLPGLASLVSWILSANSIEEFRRRIEKGIVLIKEESEADYRCLSGVRSGVLLGFLAEQANEHKPLRELESDVYELLRLLTEINRRRIIVGRCGVFERYQEAFHAVQRQIFFASALMSVNDRL